MEMQRVDKNLLRDNFTQRLIISLSKLLIQCSQSLFKTTFIFFNQQTHTCMHMHRYANEERFFPHPLEAIEVSSTRLATPTHCFCPLQTETKGSTSHLERNFTLALAYNEPCFAAKMKKGEKWNWTPTKISKIVGENDA